MAMGKRPQQAKQGTMWVATQDLPRTAGHPFYARLNQVLDKHDFDDYVEELCQRFYADEVGRPGLPPGRYFRLLLIGYFEGLADDGDSETSIETLIDAAEQIEAVRPDGDGLQEVVGDKAARSWTESDSD